MRAVVTARNLPRLHSSQVSVTSTPVSRFAMASSSRVFVVIGDRRGARPHTGRVSLFARREGGRDCLSLDPK